MFALFDRERRAGPRVKYTGVTIADAGDKQLTCVAGDLSEGGMLLYPRELSQTRVGMPLQVTFTLPKVDRWIKVEATLQREAIVRDRYAWGIKFTEVSTDDLKVVRDYVFFMIASTAQA